MLKLLAALALLVGANTAALACSCAAPSSPEEERRSAREIVKGAVAIVDVDVLSEYQFGRGKGERVRVRKTMFGRAPRNFEIARGASASSASCDLLLTKRQRKTLILYPAGRNRFRIQSLCSDFLVGAPRYLAVTLQEARRRR